MILLESHNEDERKEERVCGGIVVGREACWASALVLGAYARLPLLTLAHPQVPLRCQEIGLVRQTSVRLAGALVTFWIPAVGHVRVSN